MYCFRSRKRSMCTTSVVLLFSISQGKTIEGRSCACSSHENEPKGVGDIVVTGKRTNELQNNKFVNNGMSTGFVGHGDYEVFNVDHINKDINYDIDSEIDSRENAEEIYSKHISSNDEECDNKSVESEEKDLGTINNLGSSDVHSEEFKELNAHINALKGGEDIPSTLELIYKEELGLFSTEKIEKSQLIDANKQVLEILIDSLKKAFLSLGINIFNEFNSVTYSKYSAILGDVEGAYKDFTVISSFITLLDVNSVVNINDLAKGLHKVLKSVNNVESTIGYGVYSCIASTLMKFVVELQVKLIGLFPTLYNGTDKDALYGQLNVKKGDFVANIDLNKSSKLVEKMLVCRYCTLRGLYDLINGISGPIFVIGGDKSEMVTVLSGNLAILAQIVSLFSDDKGCDFFKFLDKHIYSLGIKEIDKINGKSVKTLKDVISIDGIEYSEIRLKNVISKENSKIKQIFYL